MDSYGDEHGKRFHILVFFPGISYIKASTQYIKLGTKVSPDKLLHCCVFVDAQTNHVSLFLYFSEYGPGHIPMFVSNVLPSQRRLFVLKAALS